MPSGPLRLHYAAGQAEAPDDPFGAVRLDLGPGGRVDLSRERRGRRQSWSGWTDPDLLQRVAAHLAAADPDFPPPPPPPGAGPVTIRLESSEGVLAFHTHTSALARQPGLREAAALLDLLVRAASGGAVPCGFGEPPPFRPEA